VAVVTPAVMAAEFAVKANNAVARAGTAVIATAAHIQRGARQNVPVDTGFLRSSITRESRRNSQGAVSEVGPEAAYGAFVENGTRFMAGRPYLLPAALDAEPMFEQALDSIVGFDVTPTFGVSSVLPSMFGADAAQVGVDA
jgi:HK97 gp10 family phage protein